ncbi:UNVERIFIED_CONTAM: hypothetical protein Scaly_2891600 [Sesamum calycinum]|uniref:RNase H type-1 domain-containing protein n=1 Tax=Sesamum calycinum TaxID=2727403 RepID=A0AAW2L7U4_9LAMI
MSGAKNHNTHPMNAILSASLYKTLDVLCHGSRLGIFQIQSSEDFCWNSSMEQMRSKAVETYSIIHSGFSLLLLYKSRAYWRTLRSIVGCNSRLTTLSLRFSAIFTHYRRCLGLPRVVRWSTHSPAWFKPNSDGSSLGNPRPAEAAGIIQDADGHVRFAYQVALGTRTNVIAELTAVWCGLEFALAHGLAPIVVQVDATTMIRLLQSRASGKGRCNILILNIVQIQQMLWSDVRHNFREANGVADHFTKSCCWKFLVSNNETTF